MANEFVLSGIAKDVDKLVESNSQGIQHVQKSSARIIEAIKWIADRILPYEWTEQVTRRIAELTKIISVPANWALSWIIQTASTAVQSVWWVYWSNVVDSVSWISANILNRKPKEAWSEALRLWKSVLNPVVDLFNGVVRWKEVKVWARSARKEV